MRAGVNWSLIGGLLAGLMASLSIGAIVAGQAAGQARIEQDLKDLRQDVAELKVDVKSLRAHTASSTPAQTTAPVPDEISADPNPPTIYADMDDWRDRFVHDHCSRCPECCIRLSVAALP